MNGLGQSETGAGRAEPCLDRTSRSRIGAVLRVTYEAFDKEPLPVEHIELLLALRRKEREQRRRLDDASRS